MVRMMGHIAGARPVTQSPLTEVAPWAHPRVIILRNSKGHHPAVSQGEGSWNELTPSPEFMRPAVRVRAVDLRAAAQRSAAIRGANRSVMMPPSVLIDVEVLIHRDARSARSELARLDSRLDAPYTSTSMVYIGTPRGLAGLIADIHTLDIADGVTLLPLSAPHVEEHILNNVMPLLEAIRTAR
jgi:hypothetical protein